MHKRQLIGNAVGLTLAAMSGTAMAAEGLSYTFAELDYVTRDIDAFDDDDDFIEDFDDGGGWSVEGSFAVADNFFIFGGYSNTESDITFANDDVFPLPAEEDTKQLSAGVGLNYAIMDNTDFVGRIAYTDIDYGDFEVGGDTGDLSELGDDESDGFFVDAGVRSQLADRLEGSIGVRYADIEEIDNTSLVGNLMYEFHENWGVNLAINAGDDLSLYSIGIRWIGAER